MKKIGYLMLVLLIIQTVGCSSISLDSIVVDPVELILEVNETQQLTLATIPEDADVDDIVWSSSDSQVAEVDQNGNITAIAPGTATITAAANNGEKTAVCTVTVPSVPVSGLSMDETLYVRVGSAYQITPEIFPGNATDKRVSWSSSAEDIAEVKQDGTITAIAPGTAVITAITADGEHAANCSVTVIIPAGGLTLDRKTLNLSGNSTAQLSATVTPAEANQTVTWTSSDKAVATVSASGLVTGAGAGEASITVTTLCGEHTDVCTVTVTPVKVSSVTLNRSSLSILTGESAQFTASVSPASASNKSVTWQSSNPSVASINSSGKLSALAPGTTAITATTADGGKTASCTVKVTAPTGKAGNSAGNLVNLGMVAHYEGWIYFSNPDDEHRLYKVRANGGPLQKISSDKAVCGINVVDGWIYYRGVSGSNYRIFKVRTDGTGRQILYTIGSAGSNLGFSNVIVVDGWIYTGGSRLRTDGSDRQEVKYGHWASVEDGWIYYLKGNLEFDICRARMDGTGEEILYSSGSGRGTAMASRLFVENGWIYLMQRNVISRMRVGSSQLEQIKVFDSSVSNMIVDGGWIYYAERLSVTNCNLVRTSVDGKTTQTLVADIDLFPIQYYQIADGWLYYKLRADSTLPGEDFFRVRVDGGVNEPFYAHSVRGQVFDANNNQIKDATVAATYSGKDIQYFSRAIMTNFHQGNFHFYLYPGKYTIEISILNSDLTGDDTYTQEIVIDRPINDLKLILPITR